MKSAATVAAPGATAAAPPSRPVLVVPAAPGDGDGDGDGGGFSDGVGVSQRARGGGRGGRKGDVLVRQKGVLEYLGSHHAWPLATNRAMNAKQTMQKDNFVDSKTGSLRI